MPVRQTLSHPVIGERTTCTIALQLTDAADNDLELDDISTVTLTLYERTTGSVLNGRSGDDIKNAGGGTIDASGALSLELSDDDNALLSQDSVSEWHVALITWTWASGTKTGRKEVAFQVANQTKVP